MSRVYRPDEASRILSSVDADRALWLHWAAKEAAFKVVSKVYGEPPVFEHASFVVRPDGWPEGLRPVGPVVHGTVDFEELRIPFQASITDERIHATAFFGHFVDSPDSGESIQTGEAGVGRSPGPIEAGMQPFTVLLSERFTHRERASVHSHASAYVRLFARSALADALEVDETRLEIVCGTAATGRVAPSVLLDGVPTRADVSLSHHGQLVGWALALQS